MKDSQAIYNIFGVKPVSVTTSALEGEDGISNRFSSADAGVLAYTAELADGSVKRFIGKKKSFRIVLNGILMLCEGDAVLLSLLLLNHKILGYNGSALRESRLYGAVEKPLLQHLPKVYGSASRRIHGDCFIAMEEFPHAQPSRDELYKVIDAILPFHAQYYGNEKFVRTHGVNVYDRAVHRRSRSGLRRMSSHLEKENEVVFGKGKTSVINAFIDALDSEYAAVSFHRTLTHNDLSYRNISCGDSVIIYDWELACYQNPEHDIIELLISLLHQLSPEEVRSALGYHRQRLAELTGVSLTDEQYSAILRFCTLEFCVNKLSMLRIAARRISLPHIEQLAKNTSAMMDILDIT